MHSFSYLSDTVEKRLSGSMLPVLRLPVLRLPVLRAGFDRYSRCNRPHSACCRC